MGRAVEERQLLGSREQGDPLGRGAKSQTLTGFVTLNNCLLYGPSSVALCQQLLFQLYSCGPRRLCFSRNTGKLGTIGRKEREEETRESSPVLVPSLTNRFFLCRLCSQPLCHRAWDVAGVYWAGSLRTQERAGLEGTEALS